MLAINCVVCERVSELLSRVLRRFVEKVESNTFISIYLAHVVPPHVPLVQLMVE